VQLTPMLEWERCWCSRVCTTNPCWQGHCCWTKCRGEVRTTRETCEALAAVRPSRSETLPTEWSDFPTSDLWNCHTHTYRHYSFTQI